MHLLLSNGFLISDIVPADKNSYVTQLREKQIYDQTLAIPYPYTLADAEWWIQNVAENAKKQGRTVNWAIRKSDGDLIGGIGFHDFNLGKSHKAELGYWLAKAFWNQGIMSEAVRMVSDFAFTELGLVRITAHVFHFNVGSARVLEKAGYEYEGYLKKHYLKDGKIFDGKLYAKVN